MRWALALLVLVALIAVATEAQKKQKKTNARALVSAKPRQARALRTNRQVKARTGTVRRRSVNARRSSANTRGKSVIVIGNGSSSSSSSSSKPAARCKSSSTSCYANAYVCGRWAYTRQCHRFPNDCLLERANCRATKSSKSLYNTKRSKASIRLFSPNTGWNLVGRGNCTNISLNKTGTCISTFSSSSSSSTSSSTSSSGSGWSSILSSILGTSSSSSNVVPIIIRTG
ncbi:hypothetical protein KR018_001809 [Drosophila ironensis]|nr:hypothetical protein KR018_001809 [Drosophila ironensis]